MFGYFLSCPRFSLFYSHHEEHPDAGINCEHEEKQENKNNCFVEKALSRVLMPFNVVYFLNLRVLRALRGGNVFVFLIFRGRR